MSTGYSDHILKRLQKEELEILLVVAEICEKNGLTYFLDSGTALGAVRHGGFIPWDDDIDIGLPQEDYLRFLELAPRQLPNAYALKTYENTPTQPGFWAKVFKKNTRFIDAVSYEAGIEEGIFIDIFNFRQLDLNPSRQKRQVRAADFWQKVSYLRSITNPRKLDGTSYSLPWRIVFRCAHAFIKTFFSREFIKKRFDNVWENADKGPLWVSASYCTYNPCETETLFPTKILEFEGHAFQGPNNPDQYLTDKFGNYMTLPPEDKRHAHTPRILDFGDGVNVMAQDAGEA